MALLKAQGPLSRHFPLKFSLPCDLFLHFFTDGSLSRHVLLHCSNETFVHALWVNFEIQQLWVHQYPRLFYWDYNLIEVFRLCSKDFIENRNIFQLFSTHPYLVCYCQTRAKYSLMLSPIYILRISKYLKGWRTEHFTLALPSNIVSRMLVNWLERQFLTLRFNSVSVPQGF